MKYNTTIKGSYGFKNQKALKAKGEN